MKVSHFVNRATFAFMFIVGPVLAACSGPAEGAGGPLDEGSGPSESTAGRQGQPASGAVETDGLRPGDPLPAALKERLIRPDMTEEQKDAIRHGVFGEIRAVSPDLAGASLPEGQEFKSNTMFVRTAWATNAGTDATIEFQAHSSSSGWINTFWFFNGVGPWFETGHDDSLTVSPSFPSDIDMITVTDDKTGPGAAWKLGLILPFNDRLQCKFGTPTGEGWIGNGFSWSPTLACNPS